LALAEAVGTVADMLQYMDAKNVRVFCSGESNVITNLE
jgi:hypothetical protein